MKLDHNCRKTISGLALAVALAAAGTAWAGGTMGDDDHDDSRHVIGAVRDLGTGPLPDARVTAGTKGTGSTFVTRTDTSGRYRITGFAADLDAKSVDVACTKDGYRHIRSVMRNPNPPPEAPVEVDCLMEKAK